MILKIVIKLEMKPSILSSPIGCKGSIAEISALIAAQSSNSAMFYPANYGFIPHTLADDGDPVDILVLNEYPLL